MIRTPAKRSVGLRFQRERLSPSPHPVDRQSWLRRHPTPIARPTALPLMALFVDPRCGGKRELLAAAAGKAQTVMLTTSQDGIRQISKHMSGRGAFAGLLIAAADDASSIEIGSTRLTIPGLYAYENELRGIGGALAQGGFVRLLGRGGNRPNDDILAAMLCRLTGVEVICSEMPAHLDEIWTASGAHHHGATGRSCRAAQRTTPPAASCPD